MKLPSDPHLLYSVVNMKLRNDCTEPGELAHNLGVERGDLEQRMAQAGYYCVADLRQFRLK